MVLASACTAPDRGSSPSPSNTTGATPVNAAPGAPSSAPASSPGSCGALAAKRTRADELAAAGKIDRAARVLRAAIDACPERAPEAWEPLIARLVELGRAEEVEALAATIRGRADAPATARDAAARAVEKVAPLALHPAEPAARRSAHRLFADAMLEGDRRKARDGFLRAVEALPPGGPALYQAARLEARDGDAAAAQRLFDRALTAIQRTTHRAPAISRSGDWQGLRSIETAASGRLVMAAAESDWLVLDAIGWRPRFDYDREPESAALSSDGTLTIAAFGRKLFSCSLVEAACTSIDTKSPVRGLSLSADGETLATLAEDGEVAVLDAATLSARAGVPRNRGKATAVAMAGDRLLIGLDDGQVLRMRLDTGAIEASHRGHAARVVALAFEAKGRAWLSADERSIRRGALTGEAESEPFADAAGTSEDPIRKLAPAPAGDTLFVARKSSLAAFSLATRAAVPTSFQGQGNVVGIDVAVAPRRVYVAAKRWFTMPWLSVTTTLDAYTPSEALKTDDPKPLPGSPSWGGAAAPFLQLLAAESTLVVGDDRCLVEAWDVGRGAYLRSSDKLSVFRNCHRMRLTPDGKSLLGTPDYSKLASLDLAGGAVSMLDAGAEKLDELDPAAPKDARTVALAERAVVWTDAKGGIHAGPRQGPFKDVGKSYQAPDAEGARDPAPPPAISPDGSLVAFRAAADAAEIWSVDEARARHRVKRPGISGLAFGAGGEAFVTALDGTLTVVRGNVESTIVVPDGGAVFELAAIRGGRAIAGAVDDGTIHVWSAKGGAHVATLRRAGAGALAITPAGAELFGRAEEAVECRFGPFVFGLDLCRERLVTQGALAAALAGEKVEP